MVRLLDLSKQQKLYHQQDAPPVHADNALGRPCLVLEEGIALAEAAYRMIMGLVTTRLGTSHFQQELYSCGAFRRVKSDSVPMRSIGRLMNVRHSTNAKHFAPFHDDLLPDMLLYRKSKYDLEETSNFRKFAMTLQYQDVSQLLVLSNCSHFPFPFHLQTSESLLLCLERFPKNHLHYRKP